MTDRINTLIVVLESPVRIDDIVELKKAIASFRGVASVELGEINSGECIGARMQQDQRWRSELYRLAQHGPQP